MAVLMAAFLLWPLAALHFGPRALHRLYRHLITITDPEQGN